MIDERTIGLVLAALLGGVIGSFANVLIIRWHAAASLLGRSQCPECGHILRPRHLVPIVSWLLLRGRCADCGEKIHIQYPLVEAASLLFGVIAALRHPPLTDFAPFLFEFITTISLIVPIVMDLRWKELPVEYLVNVGLFAFLYRVISALVMGASPSTFLFNIFFAVAGAVAFFGLQVVISRERWLGQGDVWFGGMMGAILGTPPLTALAIYLAYIFGGLMAFIGLLAGAYKRKSRIPFAPALAAGTIVTIWHGETLLRLVSRGIF